jgi:hypothetical protein
VAIDLNGIKSAIKNVLDTANDTGAAYDLSAGMSKRVQRVLKVNPLNVPMQASFYPFVTVFVQRKTINLDTMAGDQLKGRRTAEISFSVVGSVWEQTVPNVDEVKADNQIEMLMENIEEVIRRDYKLNNTVLWSRPSSIEYHSYPMRDDSAHLRIGELNLLCKVQY